MLRVSRQKRIKQLIFLRTNKKILWRCSLGNTILEVLNNREGWASTTGDDWSFFWVTREWMNNSFDKYKFHDRQFVCHFRNDSELTRKDMLIKNFKKAKRLLEKENPLEASNYVLPVRIIQCYALKIVSSRIEPLMSQS
uniref:Uncharacterized protein n=1 Tax=Parascaris equorum TaxID=6256 RepID=A0A914REW0_PAREQ